MLEHFHRPPGTADHHGHCDHVSGNHAAAIGARRDTEPFISYTERAGYSSDLCSYARVNLAYSKIQHSEAENMPMPDFLLCTTNICHTVIKWYENLSKELNIPPYHV